jgi:hypothetical protein
MGAINQLARERYMLPSERSRLLRGALWGEIAPELNLAEEVVLFGS